MASAGRTRVVKPLRGGQITIPARFRDELGIGADSLLQMSLVDGELRIRPLDVARRAAGSPWLKELFDLFEPVRDEARSLTEAEVDEVIERSVKAVRRKDA